MHGTVCVCAQPLRNGMSQGDTGRMASSSFSFLKKEPTVLRELVWFGPSIPVEAVKACALVGLHMMEEENSWRSDSGSSVSSSSSSENNEGNDALSVMVAEQHGRDTPWCGSREHISQRIDEQVVDPLESRDRTLQSTVEQIHDDLVTEMIEQLVKLPKTVSQDEIQTVQTLEVPLLHFINKVIAALERGMTAGSFLQDSVGAALRRAVMNSEKVSGSDRSSISVLLVWRDVRWRPSWAAERRDCRYSEAVDGRNERRFANS